MAHVFGVVNEWLTDNVCRDVRDQVPVDAYDHEGRIFKIDEESAPRCLAPRQRMPNSRREAPTDSMAPSPTARHSEVRLIGLVKPVEQVAPSCIVTATNRV